MLGALRAAPMHAVLAYLALLAAGRALLALTPPGRLGGHGLHELPGTWAASHVLGLVVLAAQWTLARQAGIELPLAAHAAPWCAFGLLQLALGPGALVPRHAPLRERASVGTLALVALAAVAVPLAVFAGAREAPWTDVVVQRLGLAGLEHVLPAASALALFVLVGEALTVVRRRPWTRALALGLLAALSIWLCDALLYGGWLHGMAALALGALGAVEWLRRGDRRGLVVALVALAGMQAIAGRVETFALAGIAGLWTFTPRAARARAAWVCAPALALWAVLALFATGWQSASASAPTAWLMTGLAVGLGGAAWLLRNLFFQQAPRVAEPRAEALFLGALLVFGTLGISLGVDPTAPVASWFALAPAWPAVFVLLAACAFPAEQPAGAA